MNLLAHKDFSGARYRGIVGGLVAAILFVVALAPGGTPDYQAARWMLACGGAALLLRLIFPIVSSKASSGEKRARGMVMALAFVGVTLWVLTLWYLAGSSSDIALLPGMARVEAARWAAFWGCCVVGVLAARSRWGINAVIAGFTLCALVVVIDAGFISLFLGLPDKRAHGYPGYWNATGISASLLGIVAMHMWLTRVFALRLVVPFASVLVGGALAATLSRAAVVLFFLGVFLHAYLEKRDRDQWIGSIVVIVCASAALVGSITTQWLLWVAPLVAVTCMLFFKQGWIGGEGAEARVRRARNRALIVIVVLLVGVGALVFSNQQKFRGAVTTGNIASHASAGRLVDPSVTSRWVWWKESLRDSKHNLIRGSGGGGFSVRRSASRDSYYVVQRPHSLLLQVFHEAGVVGAALILPAIFVFLIAFYRVRNLVQGRVLAVMTLVLFLQGMVDWTLAIPWIMTLVGVFGGVVVATAASPMLQRPKSDTVNVGTGIRSSWATSITGLVSALPILAIAGVPMVADAQEHAAIRAADEGRFGASDRYAARAMQLVPGSRSMTIRLALRERVEGADSSLEFGFRHIETYEYNRVVLVTMRSIAQESEDAAAERRINQMYDAIALPPCRRPPASC